MLKFLLNGALIQLITLALELVIFGQGQVSPINGATGVWFSMVYKYCHYNGDAEIKFCCFSCKIKGRYYPFVLFGVCTLISFGVDLPMLVGLVYGLFQVILERITTFPSGIIVKLASCLNFSSI